MAFRKAVIFERVSYEPGGDADEDGVDDPQEVEGLKRPAGR
jgi:hypothetical protein